MTDEQIKRNAEEYAGHFFGESLNADARDGYIAGAHSRDEEIKELKAYIKELRKQNAQNCNEYNAKILTLKQKINNIELKQLELITEEKIAEIFDETGIAEQARIHQFAEKLQDAMLKILNQLRNP